MATRKDLSRWRTTGVDAISKGMMVRAAAAMLVLALGGCGDSSTGISGGQSPSIEVREGEQLLSRSGTVVVPDGGQRTIRVTNTGDGDLVVRGVELTADTPGAFSLDAQPLPTPEAPVTIAPGGQSWTLQIKLAASALPEGSRARASVTIRTNPTVPDGLDSFVFYAIPERITSKLVLQPGVLDFSTIEPGTTSTKPLNVLNTGTAALDITRVEIAGDPGYTVVFEGVTVRSGNAITVSPPVTLAPGSARHADITFAPSSPTAARAELIFSSNDPAAAGGTRASLFGNLAGPCIRAVPPSLDFGAKNVGSPSRLQLELESCGDREVVVRAIELADDGGGLFSVDLASAPLPLTIPAGSRAAVPVTYFPAAFAATGPDGQPVRDRGLLRVASNAYFEDLEVELSGFGSGCCCPIAIIEVAEGDEVVPQTELHLSGALSTAPSGTVARWEWSVIQPSGSVSQFFPSATTPTPTFKTNVVGTYIFRLDVFDPSGQRSCAPAEYVVEVTSPDAIHVELLWRTPGDIDETDEGSNANFSAGSDVDLHFLYPFAVRYFDDSYDCYWLNPELEWLPPGPAGNPRLDRDDRDGGGPENLNMTIPEVGSTYRVGVHYYNDWGYGAAFATVRVYIHGVLRDQFKDVQITNADLWESHTIEWPSGRVTRVTNPDGTPNITPGYPVP